MSSKNFEILKNYEGWESETHTYEVEKGAVLKFIDAIGDDNPLYSNESTFRGLIAPPTFPITFNRPGQRPTFEGVVGARLHGEQEFSYNRPLKVGETVNVKTSVTSVEEKQGRGATLTIIRLETVGTSLNEEPIYIAKQTAMIRLIVKEQ